LGLEQKEQRGMDIIESSSFPFGRVLLSREDILNTAVDSMVDILLALRRYGFDADTAGRNALLHFQAERTADIVRS
jgi:hypothetical protein